jgi:hypothetical protein
MQSVQCQVHQCSNIIDILNIGDLAQDVLLDIINSLHFNASHYSFCDLAAEHQGATRQEDVEILYHGAGDSLS